MPWLERRLPTFELRKEVDISYPCCFGSFDNLSSVAQGAMSRIEYQVCIKHEIEGPSLDPDIDRSAILVVSRLVNRVRLRDASLEL